VMIDGPVGGDCRKTSRGAMMTTFTRPQAAAGRWHPASAHLWNLAPVGAAWMEAEQKRDPQWPFASLIAEQVKLGLPYADYYVLSVR
jgi:hypothetical protein